MDQKTTQRLTPLQKHVIRFALVLFTTIASSSVPCFGSIVSLLGAFTVSILSFVLPPLLHYQIVTKGRVERELRGVDMEEGTKEGEFLLSPTNQKGVDLLMCASGVIICIFGTWITASDISTRAAQGNC